jgi:predicted flavoprotein YhiN
VRVSSKKYDVIILGAGAAGLMCAAIAAQRGRRVLLLEKANKIGKKILMSGGGRCNFTNTIVEPENFISDNPHFCKSALNRYTQWDFIAMVERYGVEYEERKHGQLFCLHSAKDILSMLLKECDQAGVEIRTHCELGNIEAIPSNNDCDTQSEGSEKRYRLKLIHGRELDSGDRLSSLNIDCQSLVVATGALSIPTLGGSGLGYDIAQQFSLSVTDRQAGLVPFMFSDYLKPICERLSGIALEAQVSCNGQTFTENLLFTHRGISGPVILQISSYWAPGDEICIDLLPNIDAQQWLIEAKQKHGKSSLKTLLNQRLTKALVNELQGLWWPEYADIPLAQFSDKQLTDIGDKLNHWRLKPSATEGYRTAEVTRGGVDTDGISSKTMEAKQQAGLYFIGEVLDVTGHLGGFNFQWAWSSGYSGGLFV